MKHAKSKQDLIDLVIDRFPYPNQIKAVNIFLEDNAIRFTWRGHNIRVSTSLMVEEVQGRFCAGNDLAIVLEALLKMDIGTPDRIKPEEAAPPEIATALVEKMLNEGVFNYRVYDTTIDEYWELTLTQHTECNCRVKKAVKKYKW